MQKRTLLFLLLFWGLHASAKEYPKIVFPLSGTALMAFTGSPINFSATHPGVNANNLGLLNNTNRITSYQNTIELVLKDHSAFNQNAHITVTATLQYFPINSPLTPVSKIIKLEVNYRSGALTKTDISNIYAFKNAWKVVLQITNVDVTADAGTDMGQLKQKLKDFIELDAGWVEERVTRIDYHTVAAMSACKDRSTDELVISWAFLPDAESYDLEYAFVDDYTDHYNTPAAPAGIPFNFKDNSTRVSVKDTYYRLPLVFERGYILYRVRAVGWGGNDLQSPVYCQWNGADGGMVGSFANAWYHNAAHVSDNINWQSAVTFAEDGKRSDMVNYEDGTFRQRQTVTAMNLERQLPYDQPAIFQVSNEFDCPLPGEDKEREVIAGETMYDYQGRPAISIMPAPTNSKKLEYLPLLNISTVTQQPYNWQDFDRPDYTCPDTRPLSPFPNSTTGIMGASAYYSPNNPNKLGFNAFIPDAGSFPFTQVSYLQDNTARIAAQSEVGPTFKFGNNRETRFYYAAPNQEELDRMFGTEAGDALRYQKNAVMDANRQVSVSYLNPEGKIIATALAGGKPDNLDALDNRDINTIDISLMSKNVINTDDKTMTVEHQFVVTSDNTNYTFNYGITPETLDTAICSGAPVCLDCIYDIDITLNNTESCTATPLFSYTGTIGNLVNSTGETDLHCDNNSSTGAYPRQITKTLGIGTYVLTKKVTVNQQAALAYVAAVFKDTCKSEWNSILNQELSHIDTMSCYRTCANCAQPPVQTTVCDTAYCKPSPNRCDNIHAMMLADVSPGGQYGEFVRHTDGTIDASAYPLSVFNPANLLPNPTINFSLFPSNITNITDLVNNWQPAFAEILVNMHPEACLMGWCSAANVDASLDFDMQILSAQHFGNAVAAGYITAASPFTSNNTNTSTPPYQQLLNKDPWFFNGQNAGYKNTLTGKLQQYSCAQLPIDQMAMQMAWCAHNNPPQNQTGTPVMNTSAAPCTLPAGYFSTHGFGTDPALADLEWTYLRALYLSAKNEVIQQSMNDFAAANHCNSRCIGTKDYFDWGHNAGGFLQFLNLQPCQSGANPFVWVLYQDKQSRFGTNIDNILNVTAGAGVNINTGSITDLNDPCQFTQAIAGQANSINQQTAASLCGGSGATTSTAACQAQLAADFPALVNSVIAQLTTSPSVNIAQSQLSQSIRAAGITGVNGSHSGLQSQSSLAFDLKPCIDFSIPYLTTSRGFVAPLSVCCVTNITCNTGTVCGFDMKVLYPGGVSRGIHVDSKCNLLAGCKGTPETVCAQPSAFIVPVQDYLTAIFNYKTAYPGYPNATQLAGLLPSTLAGAGSGLPVVTLNTSGNFVINIGHDATGQNKGCTITLQNNDAIGGWTNIKQIVSISPDLSQAQNGSTNGFIIQALAGTTTANLTTVSIKGSASCWAMNQCPPPVTLSDTLPKLPAYPYVNSCVQDQLATAYDNTSARYNAWVDSMKNTLLQRYYTKCLKAVESLDMKYDDSQYQYTLYYYDQAGNLAKTVPPAGVKLLTHNQALQVAASRAAGYNTFIPVPHIKTTVYRYNTLSEQIWQKTPDAGESTFFYDGLGRIAASQNAVQYPNFYSYTLYDPLGRPVEGGKVKSAAINAALVRDFTNWTNFIAGQPDRTEIILSQYDAPYSLAVNTKFAGGQQNLRKRIASVLRFDNKTALDGGQYSHATHYSYDIEGNVNKLIQDYPNGIIGDRTIDYDFDLQSGKVNTVTYQRGALDQFIHQYNYDAANRLIQVKTSTNGLIWETDAEYKYYRHGPLARLELGTDKVQGLDYMYTLQGWIKGVNGTTATAETDMGQDGIVAPPGHTTQQAQLQTYTLNGVVHYLYPIAWQFGNSFNGPGYGAMHNPVARDAFGYVVDYFTGDYAAIQGNGNLAGLNQQTGAVKSLYNGNISRMYTQLQTLGNNGYNYTYDQLNRITSQEAWNLNGSYMSPLPNSAYFGKFSYDADGNILNQTRNGGASIPAMDNLDYFYYDAANNIYNPASGIPANATNKLAFVKDQVPDNNYSEDIDTQNPGNYKYDAIGNLKSDAAEHISNIDWNLQNKVSKITKTSGQTLVFDYDAGGNRVMKEQGTGMITQAVKTFYVRDGEGNVMATYTYKSGQTRYGTTMQLHWEEANLYGISRIGTYQPDSLLLAGNGNSNTTVTTADAYYSGSRGYKQYELANQLGNVLATISDRKIPVGTTGPVTYAADILSGQDYYAFGMEMPGRNTTATIKYRYGFGGQEKDDEINGDENSYTAEYWQYDPRLGKRWNIDPVVKPWESPYAGFANNPVLFNDPLGLEAEDGGGQPGTAFTVNGPEVSVSSGGDDIKKGDTFVGNDGKTYTTSSDAAVVEVPRYDFLDWLVNALHVLGGSSGFYETSKNGEAQFKDLRKGTGDEQHLDLDEILPIINILGANTGPGPEISNGETKGGMFKDVMEYLKFMVEAIKVVGEGKEVFEKELGDEEGKNEQGDNNIKKPWSPMLKIDDYETYFWAADHPEWKNSLIPHTNPDHGGGSYFPVIYQDPNTNIYYEDNQLYGYHQHKFEHGYTAKDVK